MGEQALLPAPPPRNPSVRALPPSVLLFLQRADVRRALGDDLLRDTRSFTDGEAVFRQGDNGHELFVIKRGVAAVSRTEPDGTTRRLARLLQGRSFVDRALLGDATRSAKVDACHKFSVRGIV